MSKLYRKKPVEDGLDKAKQDLLASASEGFEEWCNANVTRYFGLGAFQRELDEKIWQACSLHHAKKYEDKDAEIERLRRELRSSSESFNTLSATDAQLIEELKKENEELKKYREQWQDIAGKANLKNLIARLERLEASNEALKKQLDMVSNDLAIEVEDKRALLKDLAWALTTDTLFRSSEEVVVIHKKRADIKNRWGI